MREGEQAQDVYVVIDGQLQAWVLRDYNRVDLATMARGAVVGETGYFGEKRTATVETLTPTRLLVFTPESLERITRWYPWIAAIIYRNLNRIQAKRLANTTKLVH